MFKYAMGVEFRVTDEDREHALKRAWGQAEEKDRLASERSGKVIKTHYPESIEFRVLGNHLGFEATIASEPMERIRRITGYLTGTLDRFNDAKKAEERDRVKHEFDAK